MPYSEPILLLTGATGLVGSELCNCFFRSQPRRRIVALTRQKHQAQDLMSCPGLVALRGDVSDPQLALKHSSYAELAESVTEIVHCAADTRFGLPLNQARAINSYGTGNVLALARSCRRLEKFAHLSTVYVVGRSPGHFADAPVNHTNGFCNPYQQSKYEAERLVLEAMNEIPVAIFRLSSIFGDSQSGYVRQFNYTHQLLKLFPRNLLPVAPGDPAAPIDLIATDWATMAIARLFDFEFRPGRIYHLCVGRNESLTVRELIDLTVSIFEGHAMGQSWLPIRICVRDSPAPISRTQLSPALEQDAV